jgi:2-iminobutanoate/2-iminopropanoate deaminase
VRLATPILAYIALTLACAGCRNRPEPVHRVADGALGPYSGAVESGGLVFVSGKIGERGQSFAHEVETAIDAVEAQLAVCGLALCDVVRTTVYLSDIERYAELNEVYAARFPAPFPARSCVAVRALPGGARVELEVTAARRARHP